MCDYDEGSGRSTKRGAVVVSITALHKDAKVEVSAAGLEKLIAGILANLSDKQVAESQGSGRPLVRISVTAVHDGSTVTITS